MLQLESYDDLNSIRGKITLLDAQRVIIVWPRRGRVIRDRLDLVLLLRSCLKDGVQPAFVGLPDDLRAEAEALSIPCFPGTSEARAGKWNYFRNKKFIPFRKPARSREWTKPVSQGDRVIIGGEFSKQHSAIWFAIALLALLVMSFFMLPSAEITIHPLRSQQVLVMEIRASPSTRSPSIYGAIPADVLNVVVEAEGQTQTTGNATIPEEYASGYVEFTNLTTEEIFIPKGTVVLSIGNSPIRFETIQTIQLPPGVNTTQTVKVRSVVPGPVGNLEANEVRAIEGEVGLQANVTNPESFSGGTERRVAAPSDADYEQLFNRVMHQLREKALREIRQEVTEDQVIIPQSLVVDELMDETRHPPAGSAGDTLMLSITGRISVMAYLKADETRAVISAMDASLPEGFKAENGSEKNEMIGDFEFGEGMASWKIKTTRTIQPAHPLNTIIPEITGKRSEEASLVIQNLIASTSPPEIVLHPKWWHRLPFLPFRINLSFAGT